MIIEELFIFGSGRVPQDSRPKVTLLRAPLPDTPSPRVTAGAGGTTTTLARTTPGRQAILGDDEEAAGRMEALQEEVADKMAVYGKAGITKPKQLMDFAKNVSYKKHGGQHLSAECTYSAALSSTAPARP